MRVVLLLVSLLVYSKTFTQTDKDIHVAHSLGKDATEKIIEFLDIEYTKYSLSAKYKEYSCNLIIDEYKNGSLVKSTNVRNELKGFDEALFIGSNLISNKFLVEFLSRKLSDTLLLVKSSLGGVDFQSKLKLNDTLRYSWKEVTNVEKENFKLKPDTTLPLLTYTSAIGQQFTYFPGNYEFCRINNEYISYNNWHEKLGIVHFFIFSIRLEKE